MKIKVIMAAAVVLLGSSFIFAQAKKETAEQLASRVSRAFAAKKLFRIDTGRPYAGKVKFVVEHSLEDKFDTRSFTSFKLAANWLMRGRTETNFNGGSLKGCRSNVCTYNISGLLHNNLYIKRLEYGFTNGRPYIKTVRFLDGD